MIIEFMYKKKSILSVMAVVLAVLQLATVLFSWIVSSAIPSLPCRSMLSSEGIRWFMGSFVDNVSSPLLVWLILFVMAYGTFTHSRFKEVFAVNGIPLVQPILAENIFTLGDIPVAKYYLPSSEELAQEVCSFFDVHDCVLMQNHGVIVGGKDLRTAFYKMDTVEYYAEVCILANLTGKPCELSDEQKREIIELRKRH